MRWIPWLYARLLRFYPQAFRDRFGDEIQYVFAQAWDHTRQQGWLPVIRFCLREYMGLLVSILHARWATKRGNTMIQIIYRPRRFIPVLALICGLIAAVISMGRWGYVFAPPSPASVTAPLHEINSIRLVQFDAEYHASVIPVVQLPQDTIADYPPSRILPDLQNRLDQTVQSAPLDADFAEQLAAVLRDEQVQLGPPRPDYPPQPRYCVFKIDGLQCFDDPNSLPPFQAYSFYSGVQLQPDGRINVIWPLIEFSDGFAIPTGETETYTLTPEDRDYYHYLLPAGFIVQGHDQEGNPVVLANLASRGHGDSYWYYEFLFDVNPSGLQLRADTRYRFDISGLENFTFPVIVFSLFIPLCLAWLVLLLLGRVFQLANRRIASGRRFV